MESSLIGFLTYDVSGERLPRANLSIAMLDGDRTVFPLTTDESGTLERTLPVSEYIVTATKAGYDDTTSVFSVTVLYMALEHRIGTAYTML